MNVIVGVADMKISANPDEVLVTYALGSCLGITMYDPTTKVGGMLHVMLPSSATSPEKAERNPCTFVDTGLPKLLDALSRAGANRKRLQVKVAGGASVRAEQDDFFQIGKRNFIATKNLLWKEAVLMQANDVGGGESRTMSLAIGSGQVQLKFNGTLKAL